MSNPKDGGPAESAYTQLYRLTFAHTGAYGDERKAIEQEIIHWAATRFHEVIDRATLRDEFAGQALADLVAAQKPAPKVAAEWAYAYADAMIAQRDKGASDDG